MAEGPIRRKRIADRDCPNPLFLRWLEEWRDDAKDKGLNSFHSFNKVARSLKRYPLPLKSGTEARILEGCGEKIAKMLDKRLAEHESGNIPLDVLRQSQSSTEGPSHKRPPVDSTAHRVQRDVSSQENFSGSTHKGVSRQKSQKTTSSQGSIEPQETVANKRKKTSKEYVPAYRSGGYAVLVALLKAEEGGSYRGFMTKSELQSSAQPYSDTSFTVPDPNSYYTAWSSVSTMIRKQFVVKKGNPARYSLTEKGLEMAERLLVSSTPANVITFQEDSSTSDDDHSSDVIPDQISPQRIPLHSMSINTDRFSHQNVHDASQSHNTVQSLQSPGSSHHGSSWKNTSPTGSVRTGLSSLGYCYVDPEGKCVREKDKAAVTFDASIMVGYLVKCRKSQLRASGVNYLVDRSRRNSASDDYIHVYLGEEDTHNVCPGITEERTHTSEVAAVQNNMGQYRSQSMVTLPDSGGTSPGAVVISLEEDGSTLSDHSVEEDSCVEVTLSDSEDEMCELPLFARIGTEPVNKTKRCHKAKHSSSLGDTDIGSNQASKTHFNRSNTTAEVKTVPGTSVPCKTSGSVSTGQSLVGASTGQTLVGASTGQTLAGTCTGQSLAGTITGQSLGGTSSGESSMTVNQSTEPPMFTLSPGTFDVVLIVDNCETNSKSHFRGVLLKELSKFGVKFQVRKLQVGDFLWVAQENVSHLPGQLSLPDAREVVLEHIVERKRMDDLASSIIDKRFGEQKFRLCNCGLPKPIYLVESYGDASHFSIPEKSLKQAIANTQITDGFHITTTSNIQESVAYLTFMTRYIQSIYLNRTLEAYSLEYFSHHHGGKSCVRVPGSSSTRLMEFKEFNEAAVKNKALSITEMFAKQLMQIPGISVDKAAAIVQQYKTPINLFSAYEKCSTVKERELLLARLKSGNANRNFGPVLSRRIYLLFHLQSTH